MITVYIETFISDIFILLDSGIFFSFEARSYVPSADLEPPIFPTSLSEFLNSRVTGWCHCETHYLDFTKFGNLQT